MGKKTIVIKTPEDFVRLAWRNAEKGWQGAGEPPATPAPEPHFNEVATRAAVRTSIYTARDVGL